MPAAMPVPADGEGPPDLRPNTPDVLKYREVFTISREAWRRASKAPSTTPVCKRPSLGGCRVGTRPAYTSQERPNKNQDDDFYRHFLRQGRGMLVRFGLARRLHAA